VEKIAVNYAELSNGSWYADGKKEKKSLKNNLAQHQWKAAKNKQYDLG